VAQLLFDRVLACEQAQARAVESGYENFINRIPQRGLVVEHTDGFAHDIFGHRLALLISRCLTTLSFSFLLTA
jgi:hypothetical protein